MISETKRNRNDKHETIHVPPKLQVLVGTRAENEVSLPTSSSLTALDLALQMLQGEGNVLSLSPGPDYPSMDFSFSAVKPILPSPSILVSAVFRALTVMSQR